MGAGGLAGVSNAEEEEYHSDGEEDEAPTLFESYELGDRLGSGAFGEVRVCWKRDEGPESERYAVKIVDQQSEMVKMAEAFQSAREEINMLEGLHHPNIVQLIDVFEDDRFLYVVMEQIPGGELFKAISDRTATVVEEDVVRVGRQMFEALAYLHQIGIVHRDVKAQNILLTEPPKLPGRALETAGIKLIDFGLATKLQQDCVRSDDRQLDLVCGTPAMCAPEIWSTQDTAPHSWKHLWGTAYGAKVDVWAAGVVLYLMLYGDLPFVERHASRLAAKVCDPKSVPSYQPAHPSHQVSSVAGKFLKRVLEKNQGDRLPAAKALQEPWLKGSRKTRAMAVPIPAEVRMAAAERAKAAIEDADRPSAAEAWERARAFEARWNAAQQALQARRAAGAALQPRHPSRKHDSDSEDDGARRVLC